MRRSILLYFLIGFHTAWAEGVRFRDITFAPTEHNTVTLVGKGVETAKVIAGISKCEIAEVVDIKRQTHKTKLVTEYVSLISFYDGPDIPLDAILEVNGVKIIAKSGQEINFELLDNCTRINPIMFSSAETQMWNGHKIDKGVSVVLNRHGNSSTLQNEFGYPWDKLWSENKNLKAGDFIGSTGDKSLRRCFHISYPYNNKGDDPPKNYIIFRDKRYPSDYKRPEFWQAKSKYFGNILCSTNPDMSLMHICTPEDLSSQGPMIWSDYKENLPFDESLEEEERVEYAQEAQRLGKKCDEAVAKYEKRTGKKIPVSPFVPAKYLKDGI